MLALSWDVAVLGGVAFHVALRACPLLPQAHPRSIRGLAGRKGGAHRLHRRPELSGVRARPLLGLLGAVGAAGGTGLGSWVPATSLM